MYIYTLKIDNKLQEVVSLLSPEQVNEKGLPPHTIIGTKVTSFYQNETINVDNFQPNPKFIYFFHSVIAKYGKEIPELIAEAKRQKEGWIYIIDGRRSSPKDRVLPEDIIGAFEIKKGHISSDSYQKNDNYLIFSHKGFFRLQTILNQYLVEEINNSLM